MFWGFDLPKKPQYLEVQYRNAAKMYKMADAPRRVVGSLLFLLAVLAHIATVPVPLGPLGAYLLQNDPPNTTYVYDDVPAIEQNAWVVDPYTDWRELFTTRDFWGGELALTTSHKSYRPVTSLTYRMQVQWIGNNIGASSKGIGRVNDLAVKRSLHLCNVLTFGAVTVCFYAVCLVVMSGRSPFAALFSGSRAKRSTSSQSPEFMAAVAAFFFAVHPIHTEAVACLVGRCEILAGFFFLLSTLAYEQSSPLIIRGEGGSLGGGDLVPITTVIVRLAWHILAGFLSFISMLCKEQGITVIAIWILCDIFHIASAVSRDNDMAYRPWRNIFAKCLAQCVRHILTIAMLIASLSFRVWISGGYAPTVFSRAENPAAVEASAMTRALSFFYINMFNVWLLLFPKNLCVDWALGSIPLVESFADMRLLLPFGIIVGFMLVFTILANGGVASSSSSVASRRDSASFLNQRFLVACFGVLAMIISFLPASNLFFYVGFVVAERVLFLPSMGFCIFLAATCDLIRPRIPLLRTLAKGHGKDVSASHPLMQSDTATAKPYRGMFEIGRIAAVPIVCCLLFLFQCVSRNLQWRNDIALMRANIKSNPRNARLYHGLGVALYAAGQEDAAMENFRRAWDHWPGYNEPMNFMGVVHMKRGRREEALQSYRRALEVTPEFTKSLYNIVGILGDVGNSNVTELSEAITHLKKLTVCPLGGDEKERANLLSRIGFLQARIGLFHAASRSFERALALADTVRAAVPHAAEYMGLLHAANGRLSEAKQLHLVALRTGGDEFERARGKTIRSRMLWQVHTDAPSSTSATVADASVAVEAARVELCEGLTPAVRDQFVASGPHLTFDDPEVELLLRYNTSLVLTVFESEDLAARVHEFCRDRGWSIDGEQCLSVIATLRAEERQMRKRHGRTLGNVKYNIDLDNTFTVEFTVDEKQISIDVGPRTDVGAVVTEACLRYGMNLEKDCPKLEEHVRARQRSHINELLAPLESWRFDKCDAWALHRARKYVSFLDEQYDMVSLKRDSSPNVVQARSELFYRLSFLKNASVYASLARVYHARASESQVQNGELDKWARNARMAAIFAAPVVAAMGETEALQLRSVNWKHILEGLIDSNKALQARDVSSAWRADPLSLWRKALQELEARGGLALRTDPKKIAIVSLCQYDAAETPLAMLSIHNKVQYAEKHGYR